jgi:transcription initiation factor TFIIA large subunit
MDDDDPNKDEDGSDLDNPDGVAEEEPLNSEDDVTDEDAADLFETDNVVVCQYDKVRKYCTTEAIKCNNKFSSQTD